MSSTRFEKKSRTAPNARLKGSVTRLTICRYAFTSESFRPCHAALIRSESRENKDRTSSNAARKTENTFRSIQFQAADSWSRSHRKVDPITPVSFSKKFVTCANRSENALNTLSRIDCHPADSPSRTPFQALLMSSPRSENQPPTDDRPSFRLSKVPVIESQAPEMVFLMPSQTSDALSPSPENQSPTSPSHSLRDSKTPFSQSQTPEMAVLMPSQAPVTMLRKVSERCQASTKPATSRPMAATTMPIGFASSARLNPRTAAVAVLIAAATLLTIMIALNAANAASRPTPSANTTSLFSVSQVHRS